MFAAALRLPLTAKHRGSALLITSEVATVEYVGPVLLYPNTCTENTFIPSRPATSHLKAKAAGGVRNVRRRVILAKVGALSTGNDSREVASVAEGEPKYERGWV